MPGTTTLEARRPWRSPGLETAFDAVSGGDMSEESPAYGGGWSRASPGDIHKQIGTQLRELRRLNGMSVLLVSERSGVPASGIDLIESGVADPSISTLDRLARALDIGLVVFFEG